MTTGTDAGSTYVLGATQREYERVRRQAEVWEPAAERVLESGLFQSQRLTAGARTELDRLKIRHAGLPGRQ